MSFEDYKKHVLDAIWNVVVETEPFPHFYKTEFFPSEIYSDMMRRWPDGNDLVPMSRSGLMRPRTRQENCATNERFVSKSRYEVGRNDPSDDAIWSIVRRLLTDHDVMKGLASRFASHVPFDRPDIPGRFEIGSKFLVQSDVSGFVLGPHVDTPNKLLSLVLYCAEDEDHHGLGTALFRPSSQFLQRFPDACREFIGGFHNETDFDLEKVVAFRPNTLFGFLVSPRAFHGVREISNLDQARRTILWDIVQVSQTNEKRLAAN